MKNIIWSNILDIKDWNDYIKEIEKEEKRKLTENEKWELIYELNNDYLEDERINLNYELNNRIIAIADLGLWNGRKIGYKILSNNISDILYSDSDYVEWYSDGYNIKAKMIHHDGVNYVEYREIRNENNIDTFLNKIYNGKVTRNDINRYTKSILPYVAEIYGWKILINKK